MKKLTSLLLALALIMSLSVTVFAKADPSTVTLDKDNCSATTSSVTVSGSTTNVKAAVVVQVLDAQSNILAMESFTIVPADGGFGGTIDNLSLSYSATYTVRAADYDGGAWGSTTVTVPNRPSSGPSVTVPKAVALPFTDVAENTYYADAVRWAYTNKITDGTSATTFSPEASCTRAQVVTYLWRAAGCPEVNGTGFADVAPGSYYEKAVAWAVHSGITDGVGSGMFAPDATCTRGQIVTFLYRFHGADPLNSKDNPFADVKAGEYYADAVLWAKDSGVTDGTSATAFSPSNDCTRAQVVTFLCRLLGK